MTQSEQLNCQGDGACASAERPTRRGKRRPRVFALGLGGLLLVLNLTCLPVCIGLKPLIHVYWYESSDGGFRTMECPEKGRHFDVVLRGFARYQDECGHADALLYRTFPRQVWKCWNWADYVIQPRWRLPYREARLQPGQAY